MVHFEIDVKEEALPRLMEMLDSLEAGDVKLHDPEREMESYLAGSLYREQREKVVRTVERLEKGEASLLTSEEILERLANREKHRAS